MSRVAVDLITPSDMGPWLERAAGWMFASLALQPPSESNVVTMRSLLPTLPPAIREEATAIVGLPLSDWEPEFFSVLGPAGCPACESSYERAAMAARGPLIADVAAFYKAFAYQPETLREVPDHIAVEIDFLAFMAMKIAFARYEHRDDEADLTIEAYEKFERTHLGAWARALCEKLIATGSAHYQTAAHLLESLIAPPDGLGEAVP